MLSFKEYADVVFQLPSMSHLQLVNLKTAIIGILDNLAEIEEEEDDKRDDKRDNEDEDNELDQVPVDGDDLPW